MDSSELYLSISRALTYALVIILPLAYLPISLDPVELNKQSLLVLLTFAASLFWVGGMVSGRALSLRRGWINVFPLLLSLSAIMSAVFSKGPYLSWIGASNQEYTSVLTILSLCALFYLIVNTMGAEREMKRMICAVLISGSLVGVLTVLSLFGFPVMPLGGGSRLLNSIGTLNALAVFLIVVTVLGNALFISHRKEGSMILSGKRQSMIEQTLIAIVSACTFFILLTLDYGPLWIMLLSGMVVMFAFAMLRAKDFDAGGRFILPFFLVVLAFPFLLFFKSPVPSSLPIEVTPSHGSSFSIAKQTLGEGSMLFGSGPGTFGFNYAKFRPLAVNKTQFWNTKFDRASSFILNVLATLGVVGLLAWIAFIIATGTRGVNDALRTKEREVFLTPFVLLPAWIALTVALCLYSANVTLLFLFFLLSALLASHGMKQISSKTFGESPRMALAFSFLFVVVSTIIVTVIFVTGQRYFAEAAFAKAVRMDKSGAEIKDIVQELDRAASFNRYNDIYYRNLAQSLLLLVGKELSDVKAAEEMTAEKRQYIQALTSASVNAGVTASTLAPNNVSNWLARAAIYRELVPLIGDAAQFSVSSYQDAIKLEPNNPSHHTELGKAYFLIAENNRALMEAKDVDAAAGAKKIVEENLKLAEESFQKSIGLKDDFAPAHYQLAILFERQGKLTESVGKMESVARYNPLDVGVAFQLGLLYLRRGETNDIDRAQAAFEQAISLSPSYSNARWFLASIYEQKKDTAKAIEQVAKVLEYNQDNELVKSRLERLRSGKTTAEIPQPVEAGEVSATTVPDGQPTEPAPVTP